MRSASIAFLLLLAAASTSSAAETLSCPDLATAVRVGNCPSETDLQYTFTGYCSDNRRMYEQDTGACTDYQEYRRQKNLALWESADGSFEAYLSCDLPVEAIKTARAVRISSSKQKAISLLTCSYGEGISFTYRSRLLCTIAGDGKCAGDQTLCTATCR